MRKRKVLIATVMCGVLSLAATAHCNYLVDGAGMPAANGLYCDAGKIKCGYELQNTIYEKAGTDLAIWLSDPPF